jgi:(E)-4-hydroxy-3-methylbut-2-enyl-diphosphate synthase
MMAYQHNFQRHKTREVKVGNIVVGGNNPIWVQSMTTPDTYDIEATVAQIHRLEEAGCELVRVTVPKPQDAAVLGEIKRRIHLPLICDIHFDYKMALSALDHPVDKIRINPGNIGGMDRFRQVLRKAKNKGIPMRIGVNAGSLERDLLEKYGEPCPEAMVESALDHAKILEDNDFREFKISVKASDVFLAVAAYQGLADACDYPLHLGITEAGGLRSGTVKSSIGMGMLLWSGIGDTIRVSLSADPTEEVKVGFDMLKALNLRHRGVNVIACPSCARQNFDVISTVAKLEEAISHITTPMTVSVIGCVVNGPGEARETDIGFTGGGNDTHQVYVAGVPHHRLKDADIVEHLVEMIEKKAAEIEAAKASVAAE